MPLKPATSFFLQDSIPFHAPDSIPNDTIVPDTNQISRQYTQDEVSGIFEVLERREREFDSIARIRSELQVRRPAPPPRTIKLDTAFVPYRLDKIPEENRENPIAPAGWKWLHTKDPIREVFIETTTVDSPAERDSPAGLPGDQSALTTHSLRPDWLLVMVIFCLVMLAWLKLFYNKFLDQTMRSLLNFQLSAKLLRDQNMFQRRVAFILNLNFVLSGGMFIYLLFGYLQFGIFPFGDFMSFILYSLVVAGLLLLRYIALHIVGHVFQKQREFREYLHEILLIYKNLGVYLIPLVFIIAYIQEDYRIYLFYLGGMMLLASLILRLVKGFQLLVNKDVLIFYLILYLCTLEILPVLIIYRFFSLSVLTG